MAGIDNNVLDYLTYLPDIYRNAPEIVRTGVVTGNMATVEVTSACCC